MTDLIEVQTSVLAGAALDWAVAQVERIEVAIAEPHYGTDWRVYRPEPGGKYSPSTDWAVGGPLIEKSQVRIAQTHADGGWDAVIVTINVLIMQIGDSPLIASCRAIVTLNLGDTVQVPKELIT